MELVFDDAKRIKGGHGLTEALATLLLIALNTHGGDG